jgi:putative lipoprotein (rSAM/lipoprotein system)
MKTKILNRINAIIAFLVSVLGLTNCERTVKYGSGPEIAAEYGCPHATFEAFGKITDQEAKPLENIRVTVKKTSRGDSSEGYTFPEEFTTENGEYKVGKYSVFPMDSVDILVDDTAGVYNSDSVRLKVEYDKTNVAPSDHWNNGTGSVHYDFQLKKK